MVGLVDRPVAERVLEHRVGVLGLADHHHPGRADVEPLHDALALRGAAGGDPEAGAGEVADHRRPRPAGAGVHGDTDGLVDHHDGVVVVDDLDALDDLGDHLERVGRRRDRHVEHRPGVHPVGLADRRAVHLDVALADEVRGAGPGHPEHPGDGGVHALAGQALGHQHHALLSHRARPCPGPRPCGSRLHVARRRRSPAVPARR